MVKTGDIVFFRTAFSWKSPMSWLSCAIRAVADVDYNHVGVVVISWGVPMLNEAVGRGVISTPYKDRIKGKDIRVCRPLRDLNEKAYAIEANSFLGQTPYDVIGLMWHQLIWNTLGIWVSKQTPEEATEKFYCYEYAAYLNRVDYPDWWKVKPELFIISSWHHPIES